MICLYTEKHELEQQSLRISVHKEKWLIQIDKYNNVCKTVLNVLFYLLTKSFFLQFFSEKLKLLCSIKNSKNRFPTSLVLFFSA